MGLPSSAGYVGRWTEVGNVGENQRWVWVVESAHDLMALAGEGKNKEFTCSSQKFTKQLPPLALKLQHVWLEM